MALRTFIFDDDELIRSTLKYFLESEGYEVYAFENPEQCPYYLYRPCTCEVNISCADVIITDINMPGENGIEFIENQIHHGCKVRNIAIMSGEWEGPHIAKARDLGCKVFRKPFSIIELRDWINSIRAEVEQFNYQAATKSVRKISKKKENKGRKDRLFVQLPKLK